MLNNLTQVSKSILSDNCISSSDCSILGLNSWSWLISEVDVNLLSTHFSAWLVVEKSCKTVCDVKFTCEFWVDASTLVSAKNSRNKADNKYVINVLIIQGQM